MDNEKLNFYIDKLKEKYNRDKVVKETLEKQIEDKDLEITKLNKDKDEILLKKNLLLEASKEAKNNAKNVLEEVNTNAIQYIFSNDLSVKVDLLDDKKGAEINILSSERKTGEVVETDPANDEGGGLADIVALCSFNSISQLVGKNNKAPLFLDEPTKYVSKGNYSQKVAEYLKDISEFTGKQVFLVTHDEFLSNVGSKTYRVKKEDGISVVDDFERNEKIE